MASLLPRPPRALAALGALTAGGAASCAGALRRGRDAAPMREVITARRRRTELASDIHPQGATGQGRGEWVSSGRGDGGRAAGGPGGGRMGEGGSEAAPKPACAGEPGAAGPRGLLGLRSPAACRGARRLLHPEDVPCRCVRAGRSPCLEAEGLP